MKQFCLKAGGMITLISAIFIFIARYDFISIFKEPVDIFEDGVDEASEIKGGLPIDSDMYLLLECFGVEEVTNKSKTGKVTAKNNYAYFILPVFVGDDDTYYVAIKINEKDKEYSTYKRISDETISYLSGETDTLGSYSVKIEGVLQKLDKEKFDSMKDWFKKSGFFTSNSEISKYVLPYVFVSKERSTVKTTVIISICCFVLGIALLIAGAMMGRKYAERLKQLRSLQGRVVTINGIPINVATMDDVDRCVCAGKPDKARKVLEKTYHAEPMQAQQIVDNWSQLTGFYNM